MEVFIRAGDNLSRLPDLWRYRELFLTFAWRDIAVRYKQTFLGIAWVLLQPAIAMLILTFVFGRLAGLRAESSAPYAIVVLSGVLAWQLFSGCFTAFGQSLVSNANLIGKIFFPRLLVPLAAGVAALADFAVTLLLLVVAMVWLGVDPTMRLVVIPFLAVLTYLAALGPGLIVGAMNVRFRDFRFIVPFVVQIGLYISPVAYPISIVREKLGNWTYVYALNPMVGIVEAFRWAIIPGATFDGYLIGISLVVVVLMMGLGLAFFASEERAFADVI